MGGWEMPHKTRSRESHVAAFTGQFEAESTCSLSRSLTLRRSSS